MNKVILIFSVALAAVACQPKTTEVVSEVKEEVKDATPSAEVQQGGELFAANCGKCHKLFAPADFSDEKWKQLVPPMAKKAKLDETQGDKILQYVLWTKEHASN